MTLKPLRSASLATEVTNIPTGKRYLISTVEVQGIGIRAWQTAVFKSRFGPLKGVFKPAWRCGGVEEALARLQHEHVEAVVRTTKPSDWQLVERKLLSDLYDSQTAREVAGQREAEQQDFFEELLRLSGSEPATSTDQEPKAEE